MISKPEILLGLPHGNRLGGVATWCMNLAAELSGVGTKVSILVHDGKRTAQYKVAEGVRLHNLSGPAADWAFRRDISEVRRFLKQNGPLVYFPNGGHCGYAAAAQIKQRKPQLLRVVGVAHSDESYYYQTLRYYEPVIDRFIGVSYSIMEKLRQELPPHRHPDIICLPYGVPIPERVERKPGEPLKLLYAGRIAEHQKRVSRLSELAELLEKLGVPVEFHIAGDGPERAWLETAMSRRAVFHGPLEQTEVLKLMNDCDVIVQLSDFEGTSLMMLEAMAAGMVPVMSAVTGIDAVVEDGATGFLQPIGDIAKAAEQIRILQNDGRLLRQMSQQARQKVIRDFSIEKNAQAILEVSQMLLAEPGRNRPLPGGAFPVSKEVKIFFDKACGKLKGELRRIFFPDI